MTDGFRFDEDHLSRIPAIQVPVDPGDQYPTPAEALADGAIVAPRTMTQKMTQKL